MSFTISEDETIGGAVHRLARAQLRKAADALDDREQPLSERIHEMRTSIKKVRALLTLLDAGSRTHRRGRRTSRRLRRLAAGTAAVRDAAVMTQTFDILVNALPAREATVGGAMDEIRARLATRLSEAEHALAENDDVGHPLRALAQTLRRERRRVGRWAPGRGASAPRRRHALAAALAHTYRRARRAMREAYTHATGDAFHGWRKSVKAHRYQVQFLAPLLPPALAARAVDLQRLGELLGDEHDLTVLERTLGATPLGAGDLSVRRSLLALIDDRRRGLRAAARPLGDRLFADRARVFRRQVRAHLAGPRGSRASAGAFTERAAAPPPTPAKKAAPRSARLSIV